MTPSFTLASLRTFDAAARHQSFSRAADELDVSQPYVSAQIKVLEVRLGVALFGRDGRRVHLTEAGHLLHRYTSSALQLLTDAEQALTGLRGLEQDSVNVAASTTPGPYLLPPLLHRFASDYPGLGVSVEIGNLSAVRDAVLTKRVEFAVTAGVPETDELEVEQLGEDELVVVAGPAHRLVRRPTTSRAAELATEPFILREAGSGTRRLFERTFERLGIRPRRALEVSGVEAVKEAVAAHMGLALLSRRAIQHDLRSGRLGVVPVQDLQLRRPFCLIVLRGRRLSPAAAALWGFLRARLVDGGRPHDRGLAST